MNHEQPLTLSLLRERAELTQRQVAQALGVTVTTVSAWENGRHIPSLTPAQTKTLTQLLNCTLDDLAEALQGR